jgi:hypothetical protein
VAVKKEVLAHGLRKGYFITTPVPSDKIIFDKDLDVFLI